MASLQRSWTAHGTAHVAGGQVDVGDIEVVTEGKLAPEAAAQFEAARSGAELALSTARPGGYRVTLNGHVHDPKDEDDGSHGDSLGISLEQL